MCLWFLQQGLESTRVSPDNQGSKLRCSKAWLVPGSLRHPVVLSVTGKLPRRGFCEAAWRMRRGLAYARGLGGHA